MRSYIDFKVDKQVIVRDNAETSEEDLYGHLNFSGCIEYLHIDSKPPRSIYSFYKDGKRHREDGPAIEWADGAKEWYLNGVMLTEKEFNEKMKKPCEIDGKIVEIEGKKYKLTEIV